MIRLYAKYALSAAFALFCTSIIAQNIKGTVLDENGLAMPGVTVMIDGTTRGNSTDLEGRYNIKQAPVGQQVLVFTFIGYKEHRDTIQVPASGDLEVNHQMELDAAVLDEYIVVGYGVQRKREVTGSISKVDSKEITDIPTPSFEAALQGKASGVQVTQGSGLAGSASVVRIRGVASISAGGDPLYVVDGIPITQDYFMNGDRGGMNNNPLATINPNDIESVEILKDAAATGIYGSRGANGVILITTKSGGGSGWSFDLSAKFGIAQPTVRPNMLNSSELLQMYQEAWENDGNVGLAVLPGGISWEDARQTDTDWVDETIGLGLKGGINFAAKYGSKNLDWYMAISDDHNGSYLEGNSYNRSTFRSNLTWRLNDKVTLGMNNSINRGQNNRVDAAWSGGLGAAMSEALPIYPIYYKEDVKNADGELIHAAGDFWDQGSNPVRQRELTDWKTIEWRYINNLSVEYRPTKKLILKAYGGYEYVDLKDDKFTDALLRNGDLTAENNYNLAERWPTWVNNFNINGTATYFHDLDEKNQLTYMIGSEYQESRSVRNPRIWKDDDEVKGSFLEHPEYLDSQFDEDGSENYFRSKNEKKVFNFISAFGRINYARSNKYFAQASFRVDGSSRFGENNRYGFFPSASLGWILSEENFLKDNNVISFMKLRGGWGITGNSDIPDYQQYGYYRFAPRGYNNQDFRYLDVPPNPNIQWETANVVDVALEMGFFEDRISTILSFYNKKSSDILLNLEPQPSTGFKGIWDNAGEILNQGVEFELNTVNIDNKRLVWTTNFNISYNYNEILSIGNYTPDAISGGTNDTRVVVGSPVGTNYLVRFSHIDSETGAPVYLDINGNETYTWDPANRVEVGRVLPKAVGGMTNTFEFGQWQVGVVMIYSLGSNIYDSSAKRQLGVVSNWNMRSEIFDRWRQSGDTDVEYARLSNDTESYGLPSVWDNNTTQFLKKGDYLRVRRISVGYNFEKFNIGSMKFQGANITLSAVNVLTFTNFDGLDPEIARDFTDATDRNMSANITYLTPPQEMSFNLAMNLRF